MEEYRVIRSARKTLSLEITEDLTVLVRAPYQVSQSRIEAFVAGQQDWITAHRERCRQWQEQHPEPTEEERLDCIARAKEILPPKGGVLWPSDGADAHGADHHRCSEAVRQL